VIFDFGIPLASQYQYANQRHNFYISPKTTSLGITANSGPPPGVVFNLPGSYCNTTQTTEWCQVAEAVPDGTYTFTLTTYMSPNAAGPPLSSATTQQVNLNGQTGPPLSLTLKGIVAGVQLSLAQPHPPVGTAIYDLLHVVLTDASGSVIASDTQYNPPNTPLYNTVTLKTSDIANGPLWTRANGHVPTFTIGDQSDVFGVYAYYDGANVGPITYSASVSPVPGVTPSVMPAVLTP
jgi:hypothetical protein